MSFSYSGDPSASDKDAIRFEIQDTNSNAQLLSDAEIDWCILSQNQVAAGAPTTISGPTLYLPAAKACSVIARSFLAQADTQVGQLKITSTKRAAQYAEMAKGFRLLAQGYFSPYGGGQSRSEKQAFQQDSDAILPAFSRTEFDNPWVGSQDTVDAQDFGPPVA